LAKKKVDGFGLDSGAKTIMVHKDPNSPEPVNENESRLLKFLLPTRATTARPPTSLGGAHSRSGSSSADVALFPFMLPAC